MNKSGWSLINYQEIQEKQLLLYTPLTGVFLIGNSNYEYIVSYNTWRK